MPHADSCLDARLNSRRFGETISLSAVTYGGEVTVESDEPRPFFALVVPLSGTALLRLGDDEVPCPNTPARSCPCRPVLDELCRLASDLAVSRVRWRYGSRILTASGGESWRLARPDDRAECGAVPVGPPRQGDDQDPRPRNETHHLARAETK
ncbi:AraC-like protein [Prauserella muralis]|nr:AraC-like protein [Prauserella muralis]